jgi:hypothetical protein
LLSAIIIKWRMPDSPLTNCSWMPAFC